MKAYLEPSEVALMEKATSNLRDRLLIRLLFHLGCRISEALALKVEDIDVTRSTVIIIHLKARLKLCCADCGQRLGRSHTFCPGCGCRIEKTILEQQEHRRQRVLPIDKDTLEMLKEYIERGGPVLRDGKRLVFGKSRGDEMAKAAHAPLLGQLPIDTELARLCDEGNIERYNAEIIDSFSASLSETISAKAG